MPSILELWSFKKNIKTQHIGILGIHTFNILHHPKERDGFQQFTISVQL